ncbi:hypothetical protein DHEL01_v207535 [Diaporthe helianthi]|uniref:Uncharacterized protein n=1 Tax=Diaporthe helianthi TaxID=158607 RepID=A0A2P5HV17_DIAHE|nr:hypothetical protein DHEL01_v207535 [Diaporthe helianthi]
MQTYTPDPSPAKSSLPTEIWLQVFENFCVHCHAPSHAHADSIPDFRIAEARAGKATLQALCLVSREFRTMSQGILFHYFLSHSEGGDLEDDGYNWDRTPSFLRALILNPQLGRHVRMMSLFTQLYEISFDLPFEPDIKRKDLEQWVSVSASHNVRVPSEVTRALDGQMPDNATRLFFDEPGPMAQIRLSRAEVIEEVDSEEIEEVDPEEIEEDDWEDIEEVDDSEVGSEMFEENDWETVEHVFKWLHVLILNLVPHLTHLQRTKPLGSLEEFQDNPPILSEVREVTYEEYQRETLIESQAFFPNLRSLGARNYWLGDPLQMNCPIPPMMHLQKLSIYGPPSSVSLLLWLCPSLEDVEIHVNPWSCPEDKHDRVEWPTTAKNTLRRLAWSNSAYLEDQDEDPGFTSNCTVPLLEFKRLEILEIDQLSLLKYSKALGAKTVSSVLPKSLRILHLAFSRSVLSRLQIARQLRAIAGAKTMDLPNLTIVKVGDPPRRGAEKKKLADYVERTGVVEVMKGAGIELRIGKEAPSHSPDRSILSRPPGACATCRDPLLAPRFHDEVFSLDDIQIP